MKPNILGFFLILLSTSTLAQTPLSSGSDSLSVAEPITDAEDNFLNTADKDPVPLNMGKLYKAIGYPPLAVRAGVEGTVIVRLLVNKRGRYKSHHILNKDEVHPVLQEAVSSKIRKIKFTPAIEDGEPIAFWVNIPFHFGLKKIDK